MESEKIFNVDFSKRGKDLRWLKKDMDKDNAPAKEERKIQRAIEKSKELYGGGDVVEIKPKPAKIISFEERAKILREKRKEEEVDSIQ